MSNSFKLTLDQSNPNWHPDMQANLLFVSAMQSYYNDLLRTRGHVFLNEVLDGLGMDRTSDGAIQGWLIGEAYQCFIDLHVSDQNSDALTLSVATDGVIYRKI